MIDKEINLEVLKPKNQLFLYGYKKYFDTFIKLYEKRKLPNSIMITGLKGLGKSTFIYHFANHLLSLHEKEKYLINDFCINTSNHSYNLINKNIHPNFFILENNSQKGDIKIDQVRSLLKFVNKSTYLQDLKIILIDNIENLNKNSSNALLKILEEPNQNTFFFLIHNGFDTILDTVKSRCVEFKIFFNINEKKKIFNKLLKQYNLSIDQNEQIENFYYESPGNLFKFLYLMREFDIKENSNLSELILILLKTYESKKDHEIFTYILFLIEKFYNKLCFEKSIKLNHHFFNYQKTIHHINNFKKFNLSERNTLAFLTNIIHNEKQ